MKPYFEDDATWARMSQIVNEWVGTPFHHMSMVKQRGADCSTFIGGMFLEMGILTEVKYDFYPYDWCINGHTDLLVETVGKHLKEKLIPGLFAEELPCEEMIRGDLLAVWTYRPEWANHAAFYLGNDQLVHCRWGKGVEIRPFAKGFFEKRLKKIFRIYRSEN